MRWLLAILLSALASQATAGSQCFGTVSNGRLEGGVKIPIRGKNYEAYGALAATAGRTYVHSAVLEVLLAAYEELRRTLPNVRYVYGETGWSAGGRFRPHRTHQNGLSVDFMVPVRDRQGRPATLPRSLGNRYGYDLEFDERGRSGELTIDFEAIAAHLVALDQQARLKGAPVALVIFERRYLKYLFRTKHGEKLKELRFMTTDPWIRHDEHYHVDFAVPCRPLDA